MPINPTSAQALACSALFLLPMQIAQAQDTPCGQATALTATAYVYTDSAQLSWHPGAGATEYQLRYRAVGTQPWQFARIAQPAFTPRQLQGGTQYEYQVNSLCGTAAVSGYTAAYDFTLPARICPDPSRLSTVAVADSLDLAWAPVPDALGYRLRITPADGGPAQDHLLGGTARRYTVDSLAAGNRYVASIQSICPGGASGWLVGDTVGLSTVMALAPHTQGWALSPNPANGQTLHLQGPQGPAQVRIVDAAGRETAQGRIDLPPDAPADLADLAPFLPAAPGLYQLEVRTAHTRYTTRLVRQ